MASVDKYVTVSKDGFPDIEAKFCMSETDIENLLDAMTTHAEQGGPRSKEWLRLFNVLHTILENVRTLKMPLYDA